MVQVGDIYKANVSSDEFKALTEEMDEKKVEKVTKIFDGRECICVRNGGEMGWHNNSRTKYMVEYRVIEVK